MDERIGRLALNASIDGAAASKHVGSAPALPLSPDVSTEIRLPGAALSPTNCSRPAPDGGSRVSVIRKAVPDLIRAGRAGSSTDQTGTRSAEASNLPFAA